MTQRNPAGTPAGIAFRLVLLLLASATAVAGGDYRAEFERLKRGRDFAADPPTGIVFREHRPEGEDITFPYAFHIPKSYAPDRKWPVHFFLHGGVRYKGKGVDEADLERFEGFTIPGSISVYPRAWKQQTWWEKGQVSNIKAILETLKAEYNIDENRVTVQGVSDGGTGALYIASHYPTPFAGFVALIGSIRVLNPGNDTYGMTFHNNFTARPIYALNTTRDPLYPAREQEKIVETIQEFGGDLKWVVKSGKHNLEWFGEVRDEIQAFAGSAVRNPYPDHLRWQVDANTEFRRLNWIIAGDVIDAGSDGIVDIRKKDNDIFLASVNVKDVTLLLSTEHFDFSREIRIWVDQTPVFARIIAPSVKILRKWFDIDQDRSMLFAAELRVALAEEPRTEE